MGECCNGVLPPPQRHQQLFHTRVSRDRRLLKHVYDNVHGNIYLDPVCLKFIDTEQFQRLRDMKQLGLTCMVYPGAVHTRFEHSLGVYWLANEAIECLQTYQGLELDIDHFDIQTVKLAGLLHDLGHGPFSHLFENGFLPRVLTGSKWYYSFTVKFESVTEYPAENHKGKLSLYDPPLSPHNCLTMRTDVLPKSHEHMSGMLVDFIVDEHHIDIDSDILGRVKEMIVASCNVSAPKKSREKQFLFDIVANGRNGIDVDKFDYIGRDSRACGLGCNFQFRRLMESMRVIDDEICYPAKEYLTIHKLFATRADLHRTVYTHSKVKAIELMLVDALVKANDFLEISSHIYDPSEYWKLDDTIIKTIETAPNPELQESRDLIRRIRRRELYQFCNEFAVPKDELEHFKNITPQDIVCSQRATGITLREEDVAVSNVKIDLTCGNDNPLRSINFFKDYESGGKFPVSDDRISHLLPASYQDRIVRVYSKKPELVEAISEAFENLQLRMFGVKAQVHDTRDKKKRRK